MPSFEVPISKVNLIFGRIGMIRHECCACERARLPLKLAIKVRSNGIGLHISRPCQMRDSRRTCRIEMVYGMTVKSLREAIRGDRRARLAVQ